MATNPQTGQPTNPSPQTAVGTPRYNANPGAGNYGSGQPVTASTPAKMPGPGDIAPGATPINTGTGNTLVPGTFVGGNWYNRINQPVAQSDAVNAVRSYYGGNALSAAALPNQVAQNANQRGAVLNQLGTQYQQQGQAGAYNAAGAQRNAQTTADQYGAGAAQSFGQQNQDRAQALDAVSQLRNYYQQGPGPSQAAALLNQQSDATMAQNLALARSGRGAGDNATAMRQAMFQNANQQQVLGQQQAVNSAAEAANWRGQQLNAMGQEQNTLGNIRSGDLNAMGTSQAGQLGLGSQAQGYAGLGQQYTQMGQQNQGILANAAAGQGQAGDVLGAQMYGQQLTADTQTNLANAQLGQQNNQYNAGQINAEGALGAQLDYNQWALGKNTAVQDNATNKGINAQNQAAAAGGVASTAGTAITAISDARAKKSIRADIFDLRPAQGYSYEYKDQSAPGAAPGRQFGPMAQDLERTPAGASAVRQTPDGTKAVDTSRLSLVNTGAIAELQKKHDDLAAEIARLRGGR